MVVEGEQQDTVYCRPQHFKVCILEIWYYHKTWSLCPAFFEIPKRKGYWFRRYCGCSEVEVSQHLIFSLAAITAGPNTSTKIISVESELFAGIMPAICLRFVMLQFDVGGGECKRTRSGGGFIHAPCWDLKMYLLNTFRNTP